MLLPVLTRLLHASLMLNMDFRVIDMGFFFYIIGIAQCRIFVFTSKYMIKSHYENE